MKIAYFGDENSHTFAAAKSAFEGENLFLPCETIFSCADSLDSDKCDYCVMPLENSVEGAVFATMEVLQEYTFYIKSELILPIKHSLIAHLSADKSDIKTIYSHYQALGQCRGYLEKNFPDAKIETAKSTSDALKFICDKSVAAIARSSNNKTKILEKNIQDYSSNATKFIVLSKKPSFDGTKMSIVFDTANVPGALINVLSLIAKENINITKIESRPAKTKLGRYIFFADLDFSGDKESLTKLLAILQPHTGMLKFLGKYNSSGE